jgi:hypothetical protein
VTDSFDEKDEEGKWALKALSVKGAEAQPEAPAPANKVGKYEILEVR